MTDYKNYIGKNSTKLLEIGNLHREYIHEWQDVSRRIRIICEGLQKALNDIKKINHENRYKG